MDQTTATFVQTTPAPEATRWDDLCAYWISQLGCPPIVTIGSVFLGAYSVALPSAWLGAGIFSLLAVFLPTLYVVWLVQKGEVSDIHLPIRSQRIRPMIFTIIGTGIAWGLMSIVRSPNILLSFAAANFFQAACFFVITWRWKISIHSASAAGLAVLSWSIWGNGAIYVLLIVPLVGWSRVHLRRHTFMQTVSGAVLGGSLLSTVLFFYHL